MKKRDSALAVASLVLALLGGARAAEPKPEGTAEGAKPKESVTIVQPTPGGGVVVISEERTTKVETKPGPAAPAATAVAPDTAPRKARVAIVPAAFARELRRKWEKELADRFGIVDLSVLQNLQYTSYLIDALVNCRKFDVLEREELVSVTKELDFGESDYADVAKVVKVGQMLNADYVVIPEIRYQTLSRAKREVPFMPKLDDRLYIKFDTSVRTVDVKTGKIAASNISKMEERGRIREKEGSAVADQLRDLVDAVYAKSAQQETARIIATAYPVKIVSVSETDCVLNRGRGAVSEGDEFEVYSTGEMLVDPDTKESLGYHEARVGKVKVTKVDEKTCTASMVEGAGKIEKLQICRPVAAPAIPAAADQTAPKLD